MFCELIVTDNHENLNILTYDDDGNKKIFTLFN